MYQEGEIKIIKCESCGEVFPDFTFIADTDMTTEGCVSLTGQRNNIVLTEQRGDESIKEIESRIGSNCKVLNVRFIETKTPQGLSFQDFLKDNKPPTAVYSCIKCGSESLVIKQETKEQFLTHGELVVIDGC